MLFSRLHDASNQNLNVDVDIDVAAILTKQRQATCDHTNFDNTTLSISN
jgi:hypothetical protein